MTDSDRLRSLEFPEYASFSYSGTELDSMAEAKNYYAWIFSQFAQYIGRRTIEVGAGLGTFSDFILRSNAVTELTLLEPAANLFPLLQKRFGEDSRVKVKNGFLEDAPESHLVDSVIAVNVLEHVKDDTTFLEQSRLRLCRGGALLLLTPALPVLYGSLDRVFEHYRRYTKNDLMEKLTGAGFELVCVRYFNLLGVAAWFVAGKLLRHRTIRRRDARLYDRLAVPWGAKLETRWNPPIGSSLLAIARR